MEALEAVEHLLAVKRAAQSFPEYIRLRHPEWEIPEFHNELATILDLLERDELTNEKGEPVDNLILTMPPRHSKSTYSTVEFPSYYVGKDPRRFVMTTSYNSELATDFGREVRNIVASPLYQQIFPGTQLAKDSKSAATWRTNEEGAYFGMGLGGSTSGRPANLLIIDDPYKNRPDAESPTNRRKVWNYYESALKTRLQPTWDNRPAKQIVIHTRWHPEDLIGLLLDTQEAKDGEWLHIDFKAILHENTDHEEALWAKRFPLARLKKLKRANPREFASLYQQSPYIEGGNIVKSHWWQYYPQHLIPKQFAVIGIFVDTAFKKNEGNDYSVAVVAGLTHEGDIFVLDVIRDRMEYSELKQKIITLNTLWRGKGLRATYVEDKASGQSLIQDLRKESGVAVIAHNSGQDKVSNVHVITPIIQGGRVYLPEEAPWLEAWLKEWEQFDGKVGFDDQVDAGTMAFDTLSKTAIGPSDQVHVQGPSLLEQYNESRDLIMGHRPHEQSLNAQMKGKVRWRGWGM